MKEKGVIMSGIDFSKFSNGFKALWNKAVSDGVLSVEEQSKFDGNDLSIFYQMYKDSPEDFKGLKIERVAAQKSNSTLYSYIIDGEEYTEGNLNLKDKEKVEKVYHGADSAKLKNGIVTLYDKSEKVLTDAFGNPIRIDFSSGMKIDTSLENVQGGFEKIENEDFQRTNRRFTIALIKTMFNRAIIANQQELDKLGLLDMRTWREIAGEGIQRLADSISEQQDMITANTMKRIERLKGERDAIIGKLEPLLDKPSSFADEFSKLLGCSYQSMGMDNLRTTCFDEKSEKDGEIRYNKTVEGFKELYPENKVVKYLEGNSATNVMGNIASFCDSVADILAMFMLTGGIGTTYKTLGKTLDKATLKNFTKTSELFIKNVVNKNYKAAMAQFPKLSTFMQGAVHSAATMSTYEGGKALINSTTNGEDLTADEILSRTIDGFIGGAEMGVEMAGLQTFAIAPIMNKLSPVLGKMTGASSKIKELLKKNGEMSLEDISKVYDDCIQTTRGKIAQEGLHLGVSLPIMIPGFTGIDSAKAFLSNGDNSYKEDEFREQLLKEAKTQEERVRISAMNSFELKAEFVKRNFQAQLEGMTTIEGVSLALRRFQATRLAGQVVPKPVNNLLGAKIKTVEKDGKPLYEVVQENGKTLKFDMGKGGNVSQFSSPERAIAAYQAMYIKSHNDTVIKKAEQDCNRYEELRNKKEVNGKLIYSEEEELIILRATPEVQKKFGAEDSKLEALRKNEFENSLKPNRFVDNQEISLKLPDTPALDTCDMNRQGYAGILNFAYQKNVQQEISLCLDKIIEQIPQNFKISKFDIHPKHDKDVMLPDGTILSKNDLPNKYVMNGNIYIYCRDKDGKEYHLVATTPEDIKKAQRIYDYMSQLPRVERSIIGYVQNDIKNGIPYKQSIKTRTDNYQAAMNNAKQDNFKQRINNILSMGSSAPTEIKFVTMDSPEIANITLSLKEKINAKVKNQKLEEVLNKKKIDTMYSRNAAFGEVADNISAHLTNLFYRLSTELNLDPMKEYAYNKEMPYDTPIELPDGTKIIREKVVKDDNFKHEPNDIISYITPNDKKYSLQCFSALNAGYARNIEDMMLQAIEMQNKTKLSYVKPETKVDLTPEAKAQVKDAVQNIRNNYRASFDQIKADLKAMGLDDIGNMSIRLKGEQSLYDKIANYMLEHKGATLEDAIKDVRDAIGARTVVESGEFANHPEVKALLDAGKEREAMLRAAELQSEPAVESLKSEILKQEQNNNHLVTARISNYVSPDGIPYLSENQLADLKQFAANHGVKLKINLRIDPSDPNFSKIDENYKPTTKSQPSGYTALQVNFITKDGKIIEWQFRGDKVNEFAEGEHIPYDLRTGKNIIGEHKELEELYNPFIDMLSEKNMNKETYKEYNRYLSDYYTHLRKLELGFDSVEPKLEDYGKGFKFDERLSAKNLIVLHETAEKIKNKVLSVKDAMDEYNKKIAQNK